MLRTIYQSVQVGIIIKNKILTLSRINKKNPKRNTFKSYKGATG